MEATGEAGSRGLGPVSSLKVSDSLQGLLLHLRGVALLIPA